MKSKKLLFVLGAGASTTYGFPAGKMLVRQIVDADIVAVFKNMSLDLGITDDEFKRFQEDLRLADLSSIDAFLENNSKYIKVGKVVIAYFLGRFESNEYLYQSERDDNWYQYLVDKMLRNYAFPEIEKNNISFISYNYDRSLEFYLYNALKRSNEKISEDECIEKMTKFPILHLHGSLGLPKYSAKSKGKPYVPELTASQLLAAANSIHIISEEVEKYVEFRQAHQMVAEADRIIFLGFGYHPTNVHRLKIADNLKPDADLWGTAYGLTPSEKFFLVLDQFRHYRNINIDASTCTDLLSNHVDLLLG